MIARTKPSSRNPAASCSIVPSSGKRTGKGDHVARARRQGGERFGGALRTVAPHLAAALPAKRAADLREQQPQIVVGLGGGADGRSARSAGVLAGHGDGGRNAVDPLGLGLFQSLQKLPRVGGKALDVAALPFGIEGVEREAALAAAAEAAEDDQLAMRDVEVDRLQVMNPNAPQRDVA